jgi:hypothetical protein
MPFTRFRDPETGLVMRRVEKAPRVPGVRKPSGDTSTVMVRVHPEEYSALTGGGRHADIIREWHLAWIAQQQQKEDKK